jgi:hypothetical protein
MTGVEPSVARKRVEMPRGWSACAFGNGDEAGGRALLEDQVPRGGHHVQGAGGLMIHWYRWSSSGLVPRGQLLVPLVWLGYV